MEIDNHLLSLSMEFEKQNIIITEWETEKAKRRHDRKRSNVKRNKNKKVYFSKLMRYGADPIKLTNKKVWLICNAKETIL